MRRGIRFSDLLTIAVRSATINEGQDCEQKYSIEIATMSHDHSPTDRTSSNALNASVPTNVFIGPVGCCSNGWKIGMLLGTWRVA